MTHGFRNENGYIVWQPGASIKRNSLRLHWMCSAEFCRDKSQFFISCLKASRTNLCVDPNELRAKSKAWLVFSGNYYLLLSHQCYNPIHQLWFYSYYWFFPWIWTFKALLQEFEFPALSIPSRRPFSAKPHKIQCMKKRSDKLKD